MHPLAPRAAAAFFAPKAPDPKEFLALAKEVGELTPEGYAEMWSDAEELITGTPATTLARANRAGGPSKERLDDIKEIARLLSFTPRFFQRAVIQIFRAQAQKFLNTPADFPPPSNTTPISGLTPSEYRRAMREKTILNPTSAVPESIISIPGVTPRS